MIRGTVNYFCRCCDSMGFSTPPPVLLERSGHFEHSLNRNSKTHAHIHTITATHSQVKCTLTSVDCNVIRLHPVRKSVKCPQKSLGKSKSETQIYCYSTSHVLDAHTLKQCHFRENSQKIFSIFLISFNCS